MLFFWWISLNVLYILKRVRKTFLKLHFSRLSWKIIYIYGFSIEYLRCFACELWTSLKLSLFLIRITNTQFNKFVRDLMLEKPAANEFCGNPRLSLSHLTLYLITRGNFVVHLNSMDCGYTSVSSVLYLEICKWRESLWADVKKNHPRIMTLELS